VTNTALPFTNGGGHAPGGQPRGPLVQ
jgi:hypothetical protein